MSASGETKLVFELSGTGASISEMQQTTTTTTPTPGSSDTGIFTNEDGSLKSSSIIGGAICALTILSIIVLRYMKNPHAKHAFLTNDFGIHDKNGVTKKLGIFGGFFALMILVSGAILPNLLPEAESASAADLAVTLGSEESSGVLTSSGALSSTGSTTFITISEEVTCTVACSISINTPATLGNSLNLDNNTAQGYIKPTSGTSSAKSSLSANEWGYTVTTSPTASGKYWANVPTTSTQIGKTTTAKSSLKVIYGINVNNKIPAGSYSTTVQYTAVSE